MNDLGLCEVLEPKISENKEIVSAIIEYLYANSVDEVNFNDVLHDVIYKLKLESLKDSANNKWVWCKDAKSTEDKPIFNWGWQRGKENI